MIVTSRTISHANLRKPPRKVNVTSVDSDDTRGIVYLNKVPFLRKRAAPQIAGVSIGEKWREKSLPRCLTSCLSRAVRESARPPFAAIRHPARRAEEADKELWGEEIGKTQ